MDEILTLDQPFRKKRYVWNIIRGKAFYKELATYVIRNVQWVMDGTLLKDNKATMDNIEMLVHEVVTTETNTRAIKSFVWNVTKRIPLLTVDTIPYMSPDRVKNVLMSEKLVLNDAALDPFIDTITQLRGQLAESTKLADSLADMIGDE